MSTCALQAEAFGILARLLPRILSRSLMRPQLRAWDTRLSWLWLNILVSVSHTTTNISFLSLIARWRGGTLSMFARLSTHTTDLLTTCSTWIPGF